MQLNGLIFPVPPCSYTIKSQNLIWIPSNPIHTPAYQLKALCQKNRLHQKMSIESKNQNKHSSLFAKSLSHFLHCFCIQESDSDIYEDTQQSRYSYENHFKQEKRSQSSLSIQTTKASIIRQNQDSDFEQNRIIQQSSLTPPRRIHKLITSQNNSKDTSENCELHGLNKTKSTATSKNYLNSSYQEKPEGKVLRTKNTKEQQIQQKRNIRNNYLSQNRGKNKQEQFKTTNSSQHSHKQDQGYSPQERKLKKANIQKKQPQKNEQLHQHSNSQNDLKTSELNIPKNCIQSPHNSQSHIPSFSSQSQSSNLDDFSLLEHTSTYLPSNSIPQQSISSLVHTSSTNTTSSSIKTYTKPTIPSLQRAVKLGPNLEKVCQSFIPCLYLPANSGSNKILIYFHGNAEDLGYSYEFASSLRQYLQVNVLVGEYPGYGLYRGNPNHDQILADADSIYEFVRKTLNVPSKDIIIFGRSIGSGPACYIAGTRNIGGLILMCPYTSIRSVVKNIAGSILSLLVAERFRNIDCIKGVKAPTLFIHGKKDELVPYYNSLQLMECIQHISYIHLPSEMTHNDFDFMKDLIEPTQEFFCQANINIDNMQQIKIPSIYNTYTTR